MKKLFFSIPVIFLIAALFAGCNNGNQSAKTQISNKEKTSEQYISEKSNGKQFVVGCIVNEDNNYFKILQLGMADAGKDLDIKVLLSNAHGELNKELELSNTYVKMGVDGICIHPVSADFSKSILNKAEKQGIKILGAGFKFNDDSQISYIESDQWDLGKKTGEKCKEFIEMNLKGKANIAIINYKSLYYEESLKRTEGFKSEITKLEGVKIVTEQEAWLSDTAVKQAENIILNHPNVNVIWAANEGGTVGATIAVKNAQKEGKIFTFGTDVNEQVLGMLLSEDNILQTVTAQQPYEIGYKSVEQLIKEIKGEHSSAKIVIPDIQLSRDKKEDIQNFIIKYKEMVDTTD